MKCQSCGKKEATVRYIESVNGKKQEMQFCVECAKKLGFVNFSDMFSPIFTGIPEFFDSFAIQDELKCPNCGYTFEDYTNTGFLGCENCFNTFQNRLDDIFLKLHGKNRHPKIKTNNLNKIYKKTSKDNINKEDKILQLKEKLKILVKDEEYEKAAVIRDEIKILEDRK